MTGVPDTAFWPVERAGEAVAALAGLGMAATDRTGNIDVLIERTAAALETEALPVCARVRELPGLLRTAGAMLMLVPGCGLLALRGVRRGRAWLESPDGGKLVVPCAALAVLLTAGLDARFRPEIDRVIAAADIAPDRRAAVSEAMVAERMAGEDVGGLWLLRLRADAPMRRQFTEAGLFRRLSGIFALMVLTYGGEAWAWTLIGGATLTGTIDRGWLAAWLLVMLTMLPLRLLAGWNEALFALDAGRLVKSRLLAGALALPAGAVRREGVGGFIGRVMESQALESLAMGSGFAVLAAMVDLALAAWVLHLGVAPGLHLALLAAFVVITALLARGYHHAIAGWSRKRLAITDHLIEAMVGHRTRLAQERPERRERADDARMADYHHGSAAMDRATVRLGNQLAMAWNMAAIVALAPAVASGGIGPAGLAISFGGILVANRALNGLGQGLSALSQAAFAWGRVAEIVRAGARSETIGNAPTDTRASQVIEGKGLHFAYPDGPAILTGADVTLNRGDRVLVQGPSGGGKSTLAALLTGQEQPDKGLLLLDGLDHPTIGADWQRKVTSAPQFHQNHVLSGTLAFNLLMGRRWPPAPGDVDEAEALCRKLGLGPLLDRMPGGMHQRVGETGWQLSHGERSRIFLARALLQDAAVTILDESFGALDPETMDQCLAVTMAHTETLVVIAHP